VSSIRKSYDVKSWLPRTALGDGKVHSALEGIVLAWSNHWFAQGNRQYVFAQKGCSSGFQDHGLGTGWGNEGKELCVTISNNARRQIASAMLAIDVSQHRLTTPDTQIIVKLTGLVVQDLLSRLAQFLDLEAQNQQMSAVAFANQVSDHYEMFCVSFDTPVRAIDIYVRSEVANRARLKLTPPMRAQPDLSPKCLAVGRQDVSIGAHVGSTQLGYNEVYNLGAGDVLVLNRSLEENFNITVDEQICENIQCEMQEEDGQTKLRLVNA
jgi:flagellar motor switch/type III secretory pathway protein FliN